MCDMAITIGNGIVGWVDLWNGMLLADVLADHTSFHLFRYVSLPELSSGKDVILYLRINISSEIDRNLHVIAIDLKLKSCWRRLHGRELSTLGESRDGVATPDPSGAKDGLGIGDPEADRVTLGDYRAGEAG
ncbi:hypothetical protein D1007_43667 [Hordeum vulgare]|nr:hypothetical protein D1007_43667 [Hordeum vulgare]